MQAWSPSDVSLSPSTAISGIVTNTPISKEFAIPAKGALHMNVKIATSTATVAGSITAKLQTAIGSDWVDAKTVSITAGASPAQWYIQLLAERTTDQQYLPLLARGRLVITTTNAGDSTTVTAVNVLA